MRIDLIWMSISAPAPKWPLGEVHTVEGAVESVHRHMAGSALGSQADAWLFWDPALGAPDEAVMQRVLTLRGDVWHAGLKVGTAGRPQLLDCVAPTWMLNSDPTPNVEATSWRVSLRACLVKTSVLREVGGIRSQFRTLDAAALEFGHRCLMRGVLTRYVPDMVGSASLESRAELPFEDELRFVYYRFGKAWARWAALRSILSRNVSPIAALRAWKTVANELRPADPPAYAAADNRDGHCGRTGPLREPQASVLVPTVDRYPYLRTLLSQLREQSVRPCEIIVVDQTGHDRREGRLLEEFSDLPLHVILQDSPGQCTSRNAGLQTVRGDYVLFIDDDDEIGPTLIEDHLRRLNASGADVSCGVADEAGAGPLPAEFLVRRASDVFPTNNTMIRSEVLTRSGLFDLAYNRGQRADGDLGMRIYKSGALMVLDPSISVFHHHAPSGGLRTHKARVVTYASSRSRLTHRQIPSATEVYLARRYFTREQLTEMLWLSVLGTFSVRGGKTRKLLKAAISLVCLPNTWWRIRKNVRTAEEMLRIYPQIPMWGGDTSLAPSTTVAPLPGREAILVPTPE